MYWICLTKEELELAIRALEQFYANEGVATDEEEKDDKAMQELVKKLELFKEHDTIVPPEQLATRQELKRLLKGPQ